MEKLEGNAEFAIKWFNKNYMKLNTEKCKFLISGNKFEECWIKVGESQIWESKNVKLLGVTIDNKLRFEKHIENLCKKANFKLNALSRLCKFLSFEKKKIIYKAFVEAQFKYCPLVWMFCSNKSNKKNKQNTGEGIKVGIYRL